MLKRSSLPLIALILALAVGLGFLTYAFLRTEAQAGETAIAAEASLSRAVSASADAIESPQTPGPTPKRSAGERADPGDATASERSVAATLGDLELAGAQWVSGTLVFPAGTPPGEIVEVIAEGKKFSNREFHRATVGTDGSFRVAFSKDTKTGRLAIDAPHLFLASPVRVKPGVKPNEHTLEPELGGRVLGVIVPPAGASDVASEIEKSTADLWGWSRDSSFETVRRSAKLGADLRFELRGVPAGMKCSVSCTTPTWAGSSVEISVEPGMAAEIELEMKLGLRLVGITLDEQGLPVGGANVMVESSIGEGDNTSWGGGLSDAKTGVFDLPRTEPGRIVLGAEKQGYLPVKLELGTLAAGETRKGIELRMARGGFVSGRVLWPDGTAVEKARVSVTPMDESEEDESSDLSDSERLVTGADGKFSIAGLGSRTVLVAAAAAERALDPAPAGEREEESVEKPNVRRTKWTAMLEDVSPGSDGLVLTLQPGHSLTGRVVDDLGTAVKRFVVVATAAEDARHADSVLGDDVLGRFDAADGNFVLEGLPAGDWLVSVRAAGQLPSADLSVRLPGNSSLGTIVLSRAAVVRGVVLAPDGSPAVGATVELQPLAAFGSDPEMYLESVEARSKSKGRFEIKSAPVGRNTLIATREGFVASESMEIELGSGQVLDSLTLKLREGGRLIVELHPLSNAQRAGRSVSAYSTSSGSEWRQASTDSSGRATLQGLEPGTWQVTLEPADAELKAADAQEDDWEIRSSLQKTANVEVVEGKTAHVVLGTPPRAPVELHGFVRSGATPVAAALVRAHFRGENGSPDEKVARCDGRGAYRMTLDQPGPYSITTSREDGDTAHSRPVEIPEVQRYSLDLELSSGVISGRVLGPDGMPVNECWVSLSLERQSTELRSDGVNGGVETDETGGFRFDGLPGAVYSISAMGDSSAQSEGVAYSREFVRVELQESATVSGVEVRLGVGGSLHGVVLNADGRPASEAFVVFRDASGAARDDLTAYTNDSGGYSFSGLAAGTWTVRAMGQGEISPEASVRIVARETARADFNLRRGTTLTVSVFESDGTPVGAAISVRDEQNRECTVWQNELAGGTVQTVGPLGPGRYTVTATNHDGQAASSEVSLSGEATLELRLSFGGN